MATHTDTARTVTPSEALTAARAKRTEPSAFSVVARVFGLLAPAERRQLVLLTGPVVVTAILEAAGLASIIPFLALLSDPAAIDKSNALRAVYEFVGIASRERFFFVVGLLVLVMMTLGNVAQALTTYAVLRFSWMRNHTLSMRLLESYLHRPYTFFVESNSADLAKNILAEVQQVVDGVVVQAVHSSARLVVIALISVQLLIVDPVMAVGVTVTFGGFYGAVYMFARRKLSRIGHDRLSANAARYKVATDIFAGIKELKLLGLERTLLQTYAAPSQVFADSMAKSSIISAVPRYALETIAFGGVLVITLYLLWSGQNLEAALPILGLYAFAAYRLLPAIQVVFTGLTKIRFNLASLEVLAHGIEDAFASSESTGHADVARMPFERDVTFNAVSYRYPGADRDSLMNLDLKIASGEWIAVVGPTGSGKTTLVDVLLGLLRPTSGNLAVDGKPLLDGERGWQKNVGYVPQQIFLTDDTVRRNIAFGIPSDQIDDTAVRDAARIAQIDEMIEQELPDGYETVIGERGVRISGGQRQRLGIARALYRKPRLLVLDEATSALDGATEAAFFAALRKQLSDRTVVSIAHRLSTTESFHRVALIERGAKVAEGSPRDALDGVGRFAILHRRDA